MNFEIKSYITSKLLFGLKCNSLKICVEKAISTGAYLTGAYLRGADLRGAYLTGADGEKIIINKTPLQIIGLHWDTFVFDSHIKIGCEFHSIKEWKNFSDGGINRMDRNALEFWKKSKKFIMLFCESNNRK